MGDQPQFVKVGAQTANWSAEEGKSVMETVLKANNNDIQLVFAQNDEMGLGAALAVEEAGLVPGKDVLIATIDGTKAALEALAAGQLSFVAEYNPLFGDTAVDVVQQGPRWRIRRVVHHRAERHVRLARSGAGGAAHPASTDPPQPDPETPDPMDTSGPAPAGPLTSVAGPSLPPEAPTRRSSHDIVTMPANVTDRRDARRVDHLPRRQGARRGRLPAVAGRGPRPHGRERCGQVHAHQGPDRRLRHRRRADLGRRRGAPAARHRRRPDRRNLGRVPGGQPVREPHDRRERDARPRGPRTVRDHGGGRPIAAPSRRSPSSASHHLDTRLPLSTLSLAMQQLVAISRAMVTDSKVLILDEPTSSLDATRGRATVHRHPSTPRSRASRSCSSRTSSTRCTRSATASPSCATAATSASS